MDTPSQEAKIFNYLILKLYFDFQSILAQGKENEYWRDEIITRKKMYSKTVYIK